jgi:hypothetical protein
VHYGEDVGVCVWLENLASGWSSRPERFEKLVRKSKAAVTLDVGRARMSPSVQSRRFDLEDLVTPHLRQVLNAHSDHEERSDRHTAPESRADLEDRLHLLTCLPCDWWVLELREEKALVETLRVVRELLGDEPEDRPHQGHCGADLHLCLTCGMSTNGCPITGNPDMAGGRVGCAPSCPSYCRWRKCPVVRASLGFWERQGPSRYRRTAFYGALSPHAGGLRGSIR